MKKINLKKIALDMTTSISKYTVTTAGERIIASNPKLTDTKVYGILTKHAAFVIDGNKMIDNHNGKLEEFAGVALLDNGIVVELMDHTVYCLNEVYIEDDGLHCSQCSVAGNVDARYVPVTEAVEKYNSNIDEARADGWNGGHYIVAYKLF